MELITFGISLDDSSSAVAVAITLEMTVSSNEAGTFNELLKTSLFSFSL